MLKAAQAALVVKSSPSDASSCEVVRVAMEVERSTWC